MSSWYYSKNSVTYGPFTKKQLKQLAQQGVILPEDMISDGTTWERASDSPNLWISTPQSPQQQTDDNWNQFIQATNSNPQATQASYQPQLQPQINKRGTRTPRSEMLFRMCMFAGLPVFAFVCFLNVMGMDINLFMAVLAIIAGVLGRTFVNWIVVNAGTKLMYRNDPAYHRFIQSGGDPYFDKSGAFLLVGGADDEDTADHGGWELVECPNCFFEFYLNVPACPNCGAQTKDNLFCPTCENFTYSPGQFVECRCCGRSLAKYG